MRTDLLLYLRGAHDGQRIIRLQQAVRLRLPSACL